MSMNHPVDRLVETARAFAPEAAREKIRLLAAVRAERRWSRRRMKSLSGVLSFLRAYPDDENVRAAAEETVPFLRETVVRATAGDATHPSFLNTGLPGSAMAHPHSLAVLDRLSVLRPGTVDFDWEEIVDEGSLADALILAGAPAEARGVEDDSIGLKDWFASVSRGDETALEAALRLFRSSPLPERARIHVWDSLSLSAMIHLTDTGSARCEVSVPGSSVCYQRRPVPREKFALPPRIRRRPSRVRRPGRAVARRVLDAALTALCTRNLEIHSLVHADPRDVTQVDFARGVSVVLAGMKPRLRSVPESDLFFLLLKNGIPVGYGPASVFLGCCEMGVNLFPEFRGGEIRSLFAQLLRTLYHVAGARYFFVVPYGMGEGNPDALRSGAFWFYRCLGFRATNPEVEKVARLEEGIMRRRPGYRCDLATLKKLSHTEAHLDLSHGACRPLDMGRLGRAVTRLVTEEYGGDREAAASATARRMIDVLEIRHHARWSPDEKEALRRMAPVVSLLNDLPAWPRRERAAVARWIRAKGGRTEAECARLGSAHARLAKQLRRVAQTGR